MWLAWLVVASGCAREALPCEVEELHGGDLVVTEIRGPQEGPDSRGEWFELHNTTTETIDLLGLRGVLTNLEGSIEIDFLVRESVEVPPGGYVVLGSLANPPPEVDYSFNSDFVGEPTIEDGGDIPTVPPTEDADPKQLFANARFELWACDRPIDSVVYAALPSLGTYSFDGALAPAAEDNDDAAHWCTNDAEAPVDGPQTEVGLPGSPGEANPPCP